MSAREEIVQGTSQELLSLAVVRVGAGVKVNIKSKLFGDYIAAQGNGRVTSRAWGNVECWSWHPTLPRLSAHKITLNDVGGALFVNDYANLSMLRLHALSDGAEVTIPGFCSRDRIEEWVGLVKAGTVYLYREIIKPVEFRLVVRTEDL